MKDFLFMYERFPIYAGVCPELEDYGRNRMITSSDWGFYKLFFITTIFLVPENNRHKNCNNYSY